MIQILCFLLPPFISVLLYEKKLGRTFSVKDFLTKYAVCIGVINIIAIGTVGILFLSPENFIECNTFTVSFSYKYLLLGGIISIIFPIACKIFKKCCNEEQVINWKKDLLPAFVLSFASSFMLFIYEPTLMYATNINDFWFDFWIMLFPMLQVFGIILIVMVSLFLIVYIVNVLLLKTAVYYKLFLLGSFVMFFLTYVQGNWLSGNLPVLAGGSIAWKKYGKFENILFLCIGLILLSIILAFVSKYGLDKTIKFLQKCVHVVFTILFVSLITIYVSPINTSESFLKSKDVFLSTWNNFDTISRTNNFIIFLVDTVESDTFTEALNENQNFKDDFDGFTYYTNAISKYPFTFYSIPQILTGESYKYEEGFSDYNKKAYNNSPILKELSADKYDISLFSPNILWSGKREIEIKNSVSLKDSKINLMTFAKLEIQYVLYKYLPYSLKSLSKAETIDFNTCKETMTEFSLYQWGNKPIYTKIKGCPILEKVDEKHFQFIHIEGAHPFFDINKDLETVNDGSYYQKVEATLTIIESYIDRLKDNGCYDNSVIVIMSDHGYVTNKSASEQESDTFNRYDPILLIKGFNERHEITISDAPISYDDLQNAFCELHRGKTSTEIFLGSGGKRKRTVLWYQWSGDESDNYMVEYETYGKNDEGNKFVPTGNIYNR